MPIRECSDSESVAVAINILSGISGSFYSKAKDVWTGIKDDEEAWKEFVREYNETLNFVREWEKGSVQGSENYIIADMVLKRLETIGKDYGMIRINR